MENDIALFFNFPSMTYYSEVLIIRPLMVHVENGLNSEQVSIMRPINIEKYMLVLRRLVFIVMVVFILSGLYNKT